MDSFDLIPLSCVVNGKFLALHGGISPELKSVKKLHYFYNLTFFFFFFKKLDDIKKIERFKEPPK